MEQISSFTDKKYGNILTNWTRKQAFQKILNKESKMKHIIILLSGSSKIVDQVEKELPEVTDTGVP